MKHDLEIATDRLSEHDQTSKRGVEINVSQNE
jgi:hypothetical protein